MLSVIVVDLWHWTPVTFLFIYAALMSIDAEVVEAGRVDGASEWRILRHIIIPLLMPAIVGVAAIRIMMGIKAFDELYLITGGGPNGATTLVSQNIRDLFFISLRFGEAAAYGLLVLAAIAIGLGVFALDPLTEEEGSLMAGITTKKRAVLGVEIALVLVAIIAIVPILWMVLVAFLPNRAITSPDWEFPFWLGNFAEVLDPVFIRQLANSVGIVVGTVVLCLVIGSLPAMPSQS